MSSTTPRVSFYKPASGEDINVTTDLNNNLDKLDTNLNFRVAASAVARNAITPVWEGLTVRQTDTGACYVSNGTLPVSASWDQVFTAGSGITALNVAAAASGTLIYNQKVGAEVINRYQVRGDGQLSWGSGSGAVDSNLYRSAANTLKTDDNLIVDLALNVNGTTTAAGALNVTGAATLSSTLAVTGNATVTGNLAVTGVGGVQYVSKTSSQNLTASNTTLQDVSTLVIPGVANAVYSFQILVFASSATDEVPDIKIGFSSPAGATIDWSSNGGNSNEAANEGWGNWLGIIGGTTATKIHGLSTTTSCIQVFGRFNVSSTAGNLQFRASQATSSTHVVTVLAGSHMFMTRIA